MTADTLFADRYRLERRLGVGGMATVQLALDTRLERYVAVKLLAEHLAADSNFASRFRREALAVARLVHPNIVQVFDFGADAQKRQYIVMEWVDGPSCAEILKELGRLETAEAADILVQSCRGLDYAHRNGVVHRDVKPGTCCAPATAARSSSPTSASPRPPSSPTSRRSAPSWARRPTSSPEQTRGEPAGPRSDLYALGVVAYQLLVGRLPYEAASLTDLARQQDVRAPAPLHELDPDIPRPLSLAVERALARDPEGRYADARRWSGRWPRRCAGRAPRRGAAEEPEDVTRPLERTAVTRPLERPRAGAPRRRIEPIDEAPPPGAHRARCAAPAVNAAPPPARRGGGLRRVAARCSLAARRRWPRWSATPARGCDQRGVRAQGEVQGAGAVGRGHQGPHPRQHALSHIAQGGAPARAAVTASARRPASTASRRAAMSSWRYARLCSVTIRAPVVSRIRNR